MFVILFRYFLTMVVRISMSYLCPVVRVVGGVLLWVVYHHTYHMILYFINIQVYSFFATDMDMVSIFFCQIKKQM